MVYSAGSAVGRPFLNEVERHLPGESFKPYEANRLLSPKGVSHITTS